MRIIYSKRKKSTNHSPEDTYISSQNFIYIPTYILTVFEIVNHTERLLEQKYVRGERKEKMSVATELKNINNRLFFFPQRPSNFHSVWDSFGYLYGFLIWFRSIHICIFVMLNTSREIYFLGACVHFCSVLDKFFVRLGSFLWDIFSFYRGQYKRQY